MAQRGCFQWYPVTGQEITQTRWNTRSFLWTSGNCVGYRGLAKRGYEVFLLRDLIKLSGRGSGKAAVGVLAWAGCSDKMNTKLDSVQYLAWGKLFITYI